MSGETRTMAPARIWATVNGARRSLPGSETYLIGGWESAPREWGTEYVRADIADDLTTAYLAGHRDGVDKIAIAQKAFAECALSALTSIAANTCCDGCQEAAKVARKALSAMGVRADSSQKAPTLTPENSNDG